MSVSVDFVNWKDTWNEMIEPLRNEILLSVPFYFDPIDNIRLTNKELDKELERVLSGIEITEYIRIFKTLYWEMNKEERRYIVTKLMRTE